VSVLKLADHWIGKLFLIYREWRIIVNLVLFEGGNPENNKERGKV